MMTLEDVEKIMDETQEAVEYQRVLFLILSCHNTYFLKIWEQLTYLNQGAYSAEKSGKS